MVPDAYSYVRTTPLTDTEPVLGADNKARGILWGLIVVQAGTWKSNIQTNQYDKETKKAQVGHDQLVYLSAGTRLSIGFKQHIQKFPLRLWHQNILTVTITCEHIWVAGNLNLKFGNGFFLRTEPIQSL